MTAGGNLGLDMVGSYKVRQGGAPELKAECSGSSVLLPQVGLVVVVVEG